MTYQQNAFEQIFTQFLAARSQEEALLKHLAALLNEPASRTAAPERIARVYAQAKSAYGHDALRFLTQPHDLLEGALPLCLAAQDEEGARRVEQLLGRIIGGAYA